MAVTQNTYTGNGSTTNYSFTFPYLNESDVKVSLDDVDQPTTAYSFANATTISFNVAPSNGVAVRIYRQTAQDIPPVSFFAGSAIRAQDLNENFLQQLYVAQETANIAKDLTTGGIAPNSITNSLLADGSVTSAKIVDGTIVNADISASAEIAVSKLADGSARQLLQTDAAGTGVEWTSNVDVPGTLDVTGAATFDSTVTATGDVTVPSLNGGPLSGARNRIINGDMRIDQRAATQTVNDGSTNFYSVDRWLGTGEATDGVFTLASSTSAPAGFTNSLLATVTTADASIGASQRYIISQRIEGNNVSDLAWGSASARSVTLSFWVFSSLTGTFGGVVRNSAGNRSYPFSYTISAANTWEQKTVSINGDTSGTWLTDTGVGLNLAFSLGAGSSFKGTAGAWSGSSLWSVTGAVDPISTNGATFRITGVQLEAGSVATPFERRSYGQELALCERYYQINQTESYVYYAGSATLYGPAPFRTKMRDAPSLVSITAITYYGLGFSAGITVVNQDGARINYPASGAGYSGARVTYSATAEL